MKILYIFLYILANTSISFSSDFEVKPLIIDYYGVVSEGNLTIAYGSDGYINYSKDEEKTWEIKKIFYNDIIRKIFIENDRIVAFTDKGQIAVSYDNAITWEFKTNIQIQGEDEWVDYFVKSDDFYIFRSLNYIYKIDKDLKNVKVIESKITLKYFENVFRKEGCYPIELIKNKILIYHDFHIIKIYDFDLNFIEDINLKEKLNLLDKPNIRGNFKITKINEDSLYIYLNATTYKTDVNFTKLDSIIYYNNTLLYHYKNEKLFANDTYGNIYLLNDSNKYELKYVCNDNMYYDKPNGKKIAINKNKIIVVSPNQFISKIEFDIDSINNYQTTVLFNASSRDKENIEILKTKINESYVSLRNYNSYYGVDINYIKPNTLNFEYRLSLFNASMPQSIYSFNGKSQIFYYDELDNKIILCSNKGQDDDYIYYSTNNGISFKTKKLERNFEKFQSSINFDNILNGKMGRIGTDFYITTTLRSSFNAKYYSYIYLTNYDFEQIFEIKYENEVFLQSKISDSLNYDILSIDKTTNKLFYKSTSNKGENWEVYKEYPNTTNLLESKELEINGKKIWTYTYYDFVTNQFNLDVIDVEKRKVYNVFSNQLTQDQMDSIDYIGFDAAKEKFYLSFFNTLMVSSSIFDQTPKWETFKYPNNGKVNKKFQVFDKTIFARYEDEKNEDNVYWINGIEMVGDPTSIENIEEVNYLYTMPPYPNPTVSEVTAKFYWDSRIDIDNSEIAVFDITGNKVSGKESLTLEKLNEWSGYIKWNCVGVPSGTYLIKIQHGNNTKTVKVVVN